MTKAGSKGQALVLSLLLAGAAALASLLLFNSGILANTKTQLQNAADAGAYSGAVMLARDHNFSAYANRAMVANQVAVAQLVSMKSYLEDAASTRNRMNDRTQSQQARLPTAPINWNLGKIPPIGAINNLYSLMAAPAVQSLDLLIRAFEKAQLVHHETTAASVMFIIDEVVKKNDPEAAVSKGTFQAAMTAIQLPRFEREYTTAHAATGNSAASDRFAGVVVDKRSTDQFIRNRESSPLPGWDSPLKSTYCPGGRAIWTSFEFEHYGGTILSSDKKRWLALDATRGDGYFFCIYIILDVPVPIYVDLSDPSTSHGEGGSGGALAGRGKVYGERNGFRSERETRDYGHALTEVSRPAMTRYRRGPGNTLDANGGLQDTYRDLTSFAKPLNQSPELNGGQVPLTVEVQRSQASVRTSSTFLGGATNIRVDPQMKGATMRTLSSAHAFFYRPNQDSSAFTRTGWKRNGDNKTEMANLFNPYWQARLRDRTDEERLGSMGAQ
ncbi:MAG: hypothetical protein AB1807_03125 [Pseudomonadota bacterium]|jgi:hypothetical protein